MSKKTSKILVLAVVAILVVAMIGLVACGPKGPEPLTAENAYATVQTNFNKAETKTATEKITLGGLSLKIGGNMVALDVKNVNIDLERAYEGSTLDLKAKIYNLDVALGGTFDVLGTVGGMIKADMNKDGKIDAKDKLNMSKETIAGFKNVVITAEVLVDMEESTLQCLDFTIAGLNSLPTSDGKPLVFLVDGDGNALPDPYTATELTTAEPLNLRHEADPNDPDDLPGALVFLNENSTSGEAGDVLEGFIKDNFSMLSLYDFKNVTLGDKAFSFNDKADLTRVYTIAQTMFDDFKAIKVGDSDVAATVQKFVGTNDVKTMIEKFITMGDLKMDAVLTSSDVEAKISSMKSSQKITVAISQDFLQNIVDNIDGIPAGLPIGALLKGGINASIDVAVDSTFTY